MKTPFSPIATFVLFRHKYSKWISALATLGVLVPLCCWVYSLSHDSRLFDWLWPIGAVSVGISALLFFRFRTILNFFVDESGDLCAVTTGYEEARLEAPLTFELEYEKVPAGIKATAADLRLEIIIFSSAGLPIMRIWGRPRNTKFLQQQWRRVKPLPITELTYITWSGRSQFGNLNEFARKSNITVADPLPKIHDAIA